MVLRVIDTDLADSIQRRCVMSFFISMFTKNREDYPTVKQLQKVALP